MRDDLWIVPLVMVLVACAVGGFGFGVKLQKGQDRESCMQYHKALPLQEIEPLCQRILEGK